MTCSTTMIDDVKSVQAVHRVSFHPLEIIPVFRRWKHSHARDILYTVIWNGLIGLVFTVIAFISTGRFSMHIAMVHQIFSQCIGFTIHALFFLGGLTVEQWVMRQNRWITVAYYSGVATLGVLIGWYVGSTLLDRDIPNILTRPSWLLGMAINSIVISLIILAIYIDREKKLLAEMAQERERARVAQLEETAATAHLRMLQAQIEPHFLFNTLANVTSLIHPDPAKAKLMLESFIHYLRGSLAASREESTTIAQEFKLMKDFLDILKIRMGDRLRVEISLPDDLASAPIPPMLIQPLVENAIKHGLEPKVEGGLLRLTASKDGAHIRVIVADTGLGFHGGTSSGIGLKNVRERMQSLFGSKGKLIIEENQPVGTRVIVQIPAEDA